MLSQWHNSCPSQDSNPPSMHLRYYYPSLLPICWNQANTLNISSMDYAIFHGIIQPFEEYIFLLSWHHIVKNRNTFFSM